MENKQNSEIEIDLKQIFMLLIGRIWVIAIVGVVCAMITFTYYKFVATEQYTSTTQIFVIDKESDKLTSSDISMYSALSNDYLQLIQTRPVLEKVIAELGLDMKTEELSKKISATKEGDSRIISISVEDPSPIIAKRIADSIAKAAADQIYAVMEAELVNVVQPANVPESPSSPATMRNTIIAFIFGVFVTCAVIVVKFLLDDTITVAEDVEKYLGISVIGTIPLYGDELEIKNKKKNNGKSKSNNVTKKPEEEKQGKKVD